MKVLHFRCEIYCLLHSKMKCICEDAAYRLAISVADRAADNRGASEAGNHFDNGYTRIGLLEVSDASILNY